MQTTQHFIKGAPVQGATCPSHCESSQQLQMKQLTERLVGGVASDIPQGMMGRGAEGKMEDVGKFHGTLSIVIYVPRFSPPKKMSIPNSPRPLQSRQWQAAEQRCSRPLNCKIHLDHSIQHLDFTRQVSNSESDMQSSLPSVPFP